MDLPSATEWGHKHPQREDERGLDFMARLSTYKIVQALWARCRGAGQKPAKLLGRTALHYALPEVVAQLAVDMATTASAAGVTEEQLHQFVEEFGKTAISE